jgi:hypothetical protein
VQGDVPLERGPALGPALLGLADRLGQALPPEAEIGADVGAARDPQPEHNRNTAPYRVTRVTHPPPAVSWGVLLKDTQQIDSVLIHPWMLIPAIPVILTVACYFLLGDGLRDAVDPYS